MAEQIPNRHGYYFCRVTQWGPISSIHLETMLREALFTRGSNPGAYSLHALGDGGSASLYQATLDVELVARFGIWKKKSISAYLRGSHQMIDGLSDTMFATSHTLHTETKNKNRHCGTSND